MGLPKFSSSSLARLSEFRGPALEPSGPEKKPPELNSGGRVVVSKDLTAPLIASPGQAYDWVQSVAVITTACGLAPPLSNMLRSVVKAVVPPAKVNCTVYVQLLF